jgi:hypothetical protein
MNYYQSIRKLSKTLSDDKLRKKAEEIKNSVGRSLLVDIEEIKSILNLENEAEPVTLDDVTTR